MQSLASKQSAARKYSTYSKDIVLVGDLLPSFVQNTYNNIQKCKELTTWTRKGVLLLHVLAHQQRFTGDTSLENAASPNELLCKNLTMDILGANPQSTYLRHFLPSEIFFDSSLTPIRSRVFSYTTLLYF